MIEFCPLCIKNGYKRKIILHQINLQEAVWLCEYSQCPFPFGYQDFTFVSRRVGETWSSEWELSTPTVLKPSGQSQISLTELGLDTPPVTPGSSNEILHKDSVFVESTCSGTSLNLNTNNVILTKANSGLSKNSSSNLRESNASESGSIDTENTGCRVSGKICASATSNKSNNQDFNNHKNDKTQMELKSSFSLCDDTNLASLDKCMSSSQGFIDACNAAEALTESVFNVEKPPQDNFSIHESTVKCKKWLSDNTKSTVLRDHCYSSPGFEKMAVESSNVLLEEPESGKMQQSRVENSNNRKPLPKVKSIEKTNVKLAGVITASNKKNLRGRSDSADQKIATKNTNHCINVCENSSESFKVETKTVTIDGFLAINVSYEIPNFVEESISIPRSAGCREEIKNENVRLDLGQEQVVNNSVVSTSIEIEAADCLESKSSQPRIISKTETQRQSMKKSLKRSIPKLAKYKGFNFGTLKKKSKTNAIHNEENIKSSLPNIPSPDNASNCSDLTWTSEASCATTATVDSKSESIGSSIDTNSKSTSICVENCSSAISSSDSKMISTFSAEMDRVLESNFNLDQVLDEYMTLGDNKDLTQNWGDDWLESLLH